MSINENFREEEIALISEATTGQNQDRLSELSNSVYMNVRKAIARNRNVDSKVINNMAQFERSSAVLYWLLKHPACHLRKELSFEVLNHKCVTCEISELKLYSECMTCTK